MAEAMHKAGDDLVAAGFYKQTLTLAILKAFLLANGSEFYKQDLLQLYSKVSTKILQIHWLLHDEQQHQMEQHNLSYDDITHLTDDLDTTDMAKQCWSLALNNQDAKIPSSRC